jgi:outer membrane cobalamin receptor
MPVSMIERIDVLKSIGKTAVYGLDGNFGVISVITRSGNRTTEYEPAGHTVNTLFRGYSSPRVFYSPRHDNADQSFNPDLRATLFWEPDIILQPGEEVDIDYFNADNASTVTIIVEGITSSGVPLTSTAEYRIND